MNSTPQLRVGTRPLRIRQGGHLLNPRGSAVIALAAVGLLLPPVFGRDFYCDPAKGSLRGDGSAERPWGSLEGVLAAGLVQLCDRQGQVRNPDAPVRPGDTILLRSGWHGVIRIPFGYNDRPITIAAEAGHSPQVGWLEIGEGRRWVIRGLAVSPSLAPKPLERIPSRLVMLGERGGPDSAELVIEDCFIFTELDSSGWSAEDWIRKARSGIWLGRNGRAHVARNNFVLNTRFGIELCAPECVCEGNVVANFSADGIRATRDGQVVRHNVIKNIFVSARDGDDNHDDGIQVFLFNVGRGTVRDLVIEGNIVVARERPDLPFPNQLQGIGCFDGPLVNFTVRNNVVWTNHYHGISLYDAQACLVENNVCFALGQSRARPWVMLGQKQNQARGNTVRNNRAHSFNFRADPAVIESGNQNVDELFFRQRLRELLAEINAHFGEVHPVAKRPRLELKD
ncbi:MAG: right-handed parallel beta-helix repeat-containing protein [Thermoguttaceae bacterium]|nr:right-handed parallel beta-helix repeat-containing protein [Thermoguttaceae bacterium]MDW8077585.1 right-handed parallel beta-helix repeat-containing protein [Thermoguttaceae bacterium]